MVSKHRKFELLDRIVQAVNDDGWNVLYVSDAHYHPFVLKIYRGNESHIIRVYIWNLTHGGGAARAKDEYRIQITGVDIFQPQPQGKTIILGWWNEGEVFAGFDFNKHTDPLGFSPSIQIKESALRKAYLNDFAPWTKDNEEIAIAFRPDFFVEYVRNLESLHSFGESAQDLEVLEEVLANPDQVNNTVIQTVSEERRTTVAMVKKKIRDNSFKSRVLTSYQKKCAFCGVQLKLIDAAHIVPVEDNGTDETSNGIALCALHHRAYDRMLVTCTEDYSVVYNEKKMANLQRIGLDGGAEDFIQMLLPMIVIPPAHTDRPHVEYIRQANQIRGWNL